MALKQIMLRKKIEQRKAALDELLAQESGLQTQSEELERAIEEAENEDEMATVDEQIEQLESEKTELDGKKNTLEGEIEALESELKELDSKAPVNNAGDSAQNPAPENPAAEEERNQFMGGDTRMKGNKYETRAQMLDRLNRPEVREFYRNVISAVTEKRGLGNAELVIPEVVIDRIRLRIGDYSKLYSEVDVVPLTGTARVIMDGAIPEAIWVEMCDPVQELATAFSGTELDGYKVGGFIPVCNAVLDDAMINLATYLENRLAQAIGKALDKAILTGTEAGKQPTGILTVLAGAPYADQRVTVDGKLPSIVSQMGLIDDGEDGPAIEEVIAVMRRSTYYARISPQTFVATADGRFVVQTTKNPTLPDGTRVVFSQYMPANQILMGDFKKYMLAERAGVTLESSNHVRFIEDQTVFKGTARYDGEPTYPEYFVQITLADPVVEEDPEAA